MRLYLSASALITAIIVSVVGFIYYSEYHQFRKILIKESEIALSSQAQLISTELKRVSNDLLFLSNNNLFINKSNYSQEKVKSLVHFLQVKEQYDQVRFINLKGMETIRVNQGTPPPYEVSHEKLQSKKERDYVQQGMQLERNEILLSKLDLNIEQGVVQIPHKPTIRFVTPVFDANGNKKGIFVLNYLVKKSRVIILCISQI